MTDPGDSSSPAEVSSPPSAAPSASSVPSSRGVLIGAEDVQKVMLDAGRDAAESAANAADSAQRAVFLHESADIDEHIKGDDLGAAKGYLAAFNAHPAFRPPLLGLIRLYSRRRSVTNLAKLLEALIKAAPNDRQRAEAIVQRGELFEDRLEDAAGGRSAYEEAVLVDPNCRVAWLALERVGMRDGDTELWRRSAARLAELTEDPSRKARLLAELASDYARDATDESIEAAAGYLHEAAALPVGRWRALVEIERFAERHGRAQDLIFALESRAALAHQMASGSDFQGGSGTFAIARLQDATEARDVAAALWVRAARVRWSVLEDADGALSAIEQALALVPDDPRFRFYALQIADLAGAAERASQHAAWLLEREVGDASLRASLHFRMAEAAATRGELDVATRSLRSSLEVSPTSPAALGALIDQLVNAGDAIGAAEEFDRVASAETDPVARAQAHRCAAVLLLGIASDTDRAVTRLRLACESDPADLLSRRLLVPLLAKSGNESERELLSGVLQAIADGTRDDDERVAVLLQKYHIERYQLRDAARAAATISQIAKALPDETWAYECAVLLHAAGRNFAEAARWASDLASRCPREVRKEWLAATSRLLLAAGDEPGARAKALEGHREEPADVYLAALAFRLALSAGERAVALDVLTERSKSAGDAAAGRWLVTGAVLLSNAGARDEAKKALDLAVERAPESTSVRAALFASSRWRADLAQRARVAEAAIDRADGAGEEAALGVELLLARVFLEHDLGAGEDAIERLATRAGADSVVVAFLHAVFQGARNGPDAPETLAALQELLSALPTNDPTRVAIDLEVARALSGSASTREQAQAARELVGEEAPQAAAPRLLALLDAIQREDRGDVPSALARVAEMADEASAGALRAAELSALRAQGRENDARILAMTFPELPASAVALSEISPSLEHAAGRTDGLLERIGIASKEDRPALQRRAAVWASIAGRHDDAATAAELLLKTDPEDVVAWDILRVSGRRRAKWERVFAASLALADRVPSPRRRAALLEEAGVVAMDQLENAARAEKAFRAALETDVQRVVAYQRLREILEGRKDFSALEGVIAKRIGAIADSDELVKLYWEQARILRALGRKEAALEAARNVVMLDAEHVAALALCAEVHASAGRLAEAAEALSGLASAREAPTSQRKVARMGAIDIYQHRLERPDLAVEQLRALVDDGAAGDEEVERGFEVAATAALWDGALFFAKEAVQRAAEPEVIAASQLRVALVYRDYLGNTTDAVKHARLAHDALPGDLDVLETVHGLCEGEERTRRSRRSIEAIREYFRHTGPEPQVALMVARAAELAGDGALMRAAQRLARALGADAEATPVATPSGATSLRDPAIALRCRHPDDVGASTSVIETALIDLCPVAAVSTEAFGVGRAERVKGPHPMRDALTPLASVAGLSAFELYIGGNDDNRVAVVPGDPPTIVVGRNVRTALNDRERFVLVRAGVLSMRGLGALQILPVDEAVLVVLAAMAAADLQPAGGTAAFESKLRPVAKAISRRSRKALAEQARGLANSSDAPGLVRAAVRAALSSARRGAMAATGAVSPALADLERAHPTDEARVELCLFAVSDALASVAKEIGVDRAGK